eukprot:CAMPEP_0119124196 /NCGR_PEP_ID=MMETSP1310-20130426/3890_1 /TAXON_ID=464262 /ORGANISM="Genus nov. species nov., Strain RCC2339" /LENGTH=86 /DNA_ID=CAMNT_0007114111 /DNA_START=292 /DNA_END=549 /DNA_ORIENTATION=+
MGTIRDIGEGRENTRQLGETALVKAASMGHETMLLVLCGGGLLGFVSQVVGESIVAFWSAQRRKATHRGPSAPAVANGCQHNTKLA